MFGESDACLKSRKGKEPIRESSEVIGDKDEVILPRDDLGELCFTKPYTFGLFSEQETGAETGPEAFDSVFTDDLGDAMKDDSEDKSTESEGSGGRKEVSLAETEQATSVQQTGEKRKRCKVVARRSRMPRSRTPSRPKSGHTKASSKAEIPTQPQPQILSQANPTTRPTRKSARLAFQATPRPAKQSSLVIEEIVSSSESSFDNDTKNTPFK